MTLSWGLQVEKYSTLYCATVIFLQKISVLCKHLSLWFWEPGHSHLMAIPCVLNHFILIRWKWWICDKMFSFFHFLLSLSHPLQMLWEWKWLKNPVIFASFFPLWLSLIYGSIISLQFLSYTFSEVSVHNTSCFVSFVLYIPVRSTKVHPFVIWPISFGPGPSCCALCVWLFYHISNFLA